MSHFRLHTIKERTYPRYLVFALAGLTAAAVLGYAVHSIGMARAKSRETVLIFTEEEFTQYLVDQTSEEYNLNGNYRLEDDLDLSGLERSIGTNLEPFAGSLDGNGHVIEGLKRPLFGVMEAARVENLFLSGAEIQNPVTYQSGEHFTDGYGALAAYVIGSEIRNCGMNGTIRTASPSEAEYLVARATSADADEMEEKGPGVEGPAGNDGAAGNGGAAEESSTVEENGTGGDGAVSGDGSGIGEGPGTGVIPGPTSATDAGPGVETGDNGSQAETENPTEPGPGTESVDSSSSNSESDGGEPTESSTPERESSAISTESRENDTVKEESGNEEMESNSHSDSSTEGSIDSSVENSAGEAESGKAESAEHNTDTESPAVSGQLESKGSNEAGNGDTAGTGTEVDAGKAAESAPEASAEITVKAAVEPEAGAVIEETIGYRSRNRHHLMMKIPEVMDFNMETLSTSTPSEAMEATPSDAQEGPAGSRSDEESQERLEESPDLKGPGIDAETDESSISQESETIQTPEGDVYIQVTADRITIGGLVAETIGETLIADSFVLVTIDSNVEQTDTYAGGMTGIVGRDGRLENSYASGLVDAAGVAGGFAAANDGVIQYSYSSTTIGKRGNVRRAFTAMGEGSLSECVYDRQMACAEETMPNPGFQTRDLENSTTLETETATESQAEETPEFTLKGLNTSQLTGLEADISGEWYLAEGAYPQLEYFAMSGQEMTEASSKASAIALRLPDGVTLEDVLEEGAVTVPGEVDGQQITWEADGNVQINGNNQVVLEDKAAVTVHEAPTVQSALAVEGGQESESEPVTEPLTQPEEAIPTEKTQEPSSAEQETASGSLKASVGGAARQFVLSAVAPRAAAGSYTTWAEVAALVETGGSLAHLQPQVVNGYYEVGTPEALAWLAYKMNAGTFGSTIKIKLTADIDLFGGEHSQKTYDPDTNNIDDALQWIPITGFAGELNGDGHEVFHIKVNETGSACGFIATAKSGAKVSNFGIGSGKITSSGIRAGGIIGYMMNSPVTITNCWNHADITGLSIVGGIAGYGLNGSYEIQKCYNTGTITSTETTNNGGAGGILGNTYMGTDSQVMTIENCYNSGSVISNSSADSGSGGIVGTQLTSPGRIRITNCYNTGTVTGKGLVGSVVGQYVSSKIVTTNCYFLDTTGTDANAKSLTDTQLKSWAAAYALNGQSMDGPWVYTANQYPGFATSDNPKLAAPEDWFVVGQGGIDGLVTAGIATMSGSTHMISTPEQLATFATVVNKGGSAYVGIDAVLQNDIDLFGSNYTGFTGEHTIDNIEQALKWAPIDNHMGPRKGYRGNFNGNRHVVDGMYVKAQQSYVGFFGKMASNGHVANIAWLGIGPNSKVVACQNGGQVGLLFGYIDPYNNTTISNCYALGEIEVMPGIRPGRVSAFGWQSGGPRPGRIINCYAAVKGVGFGGQGTTITNCFWDTTVGTASTLSGVNNVSNQELKGWGVVYALNNYNMTGPWVWDPAGDKYPTWAVGNATMPSAPDWGEIGLALSCKSDAEAGLVGDGTKASPYQISTPEQLALFGALVSRKGTDKHGELTANIDLTGAGYGGYGPSGPLPWRPIGDGSHVFNGSLNGKGKTISYMNVRFDGYAGLIGCAGGGAEIRGIGLEPTCSVEALETPMGNYEYDGTAAFVGAVKSDGTSRTQLLVKNCFNRGQVKGRRGATTGAFVGNSVGSNGVGGQRITNCYTAGALSAKDGAAPGAIAGTFITNKNDLTSGIRYCYWDSQVSGNVAEAAGNSGVVLVRDTRAMTNQEMTTQTEVLNLLNTEAETGVWTRTAGVNDGYPVYGETKPVVNSWEDVGKYHLSPPYKMEWSPDTSGITGNPFLLSTPEDLAWFAYQVNHGNTGICGELTADINLFGDKYMDITYDETDPGIKTKGLFWVPAGSGMDPLTWDKAYVGEFQGNGHVITLMNVQGETQGGLFGYVYGAGQSGKTGRIMGTGIENSYIEGTQAGGITGRLGGVAEVSRCFVRGGTVVSTDLSTDASAGGIAGYMDGMSRVEDCYVMEAEVLANGTGNIAGGIIGRKTAGGQVESCYSQMATGGKIEGTRRGAIVGRQIGSGGEETIGNMNQCYSDVGIVGDPDTIKKLVIIESDALAQEIVNDLNVKNRRERVGTDRAWYTSLSTEPTKGYPTLVTPQFINVTIPPASTSGGSQVSLPAQVTGAVFRGIRQEHGEENPAFTIKPNTEVSGAFSSWGTDSANEKLGLVAGQDIAGLKASSPDAGALTDPSASAGTISGLTLYNGAAYTYGKSRVIIVDVASAEGIRHEIRATIQAASEKTLNVVLPVQVGIEDLSPDGSLKKSFSADLSLTNQNDYPIAGNMLRLVSMTGEGYVTLKPVAKNDPYGATKQLSDPDGGVKIGIADTKAASSIVPPEGIYYTPADDRVNPPVAEKWMEYQIKGKGVLPYRYFVEYTANPHYRDINQYGYTVNYQFGISKDDVPAGVDAAVK